MYYLVFCKMFGDFVFDAKEYEFIIYKTDNKDFVINKARQLNHDVLLNITTEHFKVYQSESKAYNKKKSNLIYPNNLNPLFY